MGCNNSSSKEKLSQDDLKPILEKDPVEWTQAQVIKWLQLTHDGDLADLVEPFKAQKISGVTFVKLTEEQMKNDLEIRQFGLRDGFISARNKLLEGRNPSNGVVDGPIQSQSNTNHNHTDELKKHQSASKSKSNGRDISKGMGENTTQNVSKQASNKSELSRYSTNNDPTTDIQKSKNSPNGMSHPNPKSAEESITHSARGNKMSIESNNIHKQSTNHQTTPSKNHLITSSAAVRHNQSFDDTATNNRQEPMQAAPTNAGSGYEEIPDSFSPVPSQPNHPMGGRMQNQPPQGFNNMPSAAFQDDNGVDPDDNYARIDFADLNNSEVPPAQQSQLPPHQMAPGGMNQPNMNQQFHSHQPMNGYNSNVPFNGMGMAQSMTNMSQQQPGPNISPQTIPNDNNHHHNQTGSNYDELPLEFIHNMGQSSTNTNNQIGLGPSPNSGYPPKQSPQPGPYEEIIFDQDNLSSAPSNPDSYAKHPKVNVTKGQCVQVFDQQTGKWVDAEIESVDQYGTNVHVKYLRSNLRQLVPISNIRQLLPPSNKIHPNNPGLNQLQHMNGAGPNGASKAGGSSLGDSPIQGIPASQVDITGQHRPIISIEEKQIHEFARDLWKTLHKIDVKTIADAQNEPIRGFSGKELVRHVKKHLKKHVKDLGDKDVIARCSDLVKYQYIRLIASAKNGDNSVNDDGDKSSDPNTSIKDGSSKPSVSGLSSKDDDNKTEDKEFANSEKYLYQFENEKHREFIKDDQPDRRAWTRGTKVQIYSSTLGGWQTGTVVEVNNDTLTITYGPPTQQMRKTLDRYQDDLVKSTQQFIDNRRGWTKDSEIEVYSHGQHIWCQGKIEEVLSAKENQPVDIFRVFYTNNDDKDFSKYVDRWSPDLREVQQLPPKLAKYKKGTKVRVWSNSKQAWISGVVIDVVPTYEVVNVRYGDHEKLVPVSSDDIKLFDEDD